MPTVRMVYGDEQQVVRETYADVTVEREDGWTVLFRGKDAILRVRDEHVHTLEYMAAATALTIADLMRPAVTTVERDSHLAAAAYLMKKGGDSALVVIENNTDRTPITVITDADVAAAVADGNDPERVRISEIAKRPPITVTVHATPTEAAKLMLAEHVKHLPVLSDGQLVGVIDISDACRGLLTG